MTIVKENESLRIKRLTLGPYGTNAYIVICRKTAASALIDAPAGPETILAELENTRPAFMLLTHSHMDHTGALAEMHSALKVPFAAHELDSKDLPTRPDRGLSDGDTLRVGELELSVLHTPGHTPGALCFKVGACLLSGDTIFAGGPGRTRTPADFRQIVDSLTKKVFALPEDTLIFPGHGESTTLQKEREEFAVFSSRPHSPGICGDVVWLTS